MSLYTEENDNISSIENNSKYQKQNKIRRFMTFAIVVLAFEFTDSSSSTKIINEILVIILYYDIKICVSAILNTETVVLVNVRFFYLVVHNCKSESN